VDHLVDEPADLADVARSLGHALLAGVEFLEHHHRQVDVVLVEAEQGGRDRASARSCPARRRDAVLLAAQLDSCREPAGLHRADATGSERLDGLEDFLDVAGHLDLAPFVAQHALPSIRKVLRSTPMTLRPYMFFSRITSNIRTASRRRRKAARRETRTWP
jgi:hypothetical protein